MFAEVLSEKRLVGEIHLLGNLLDALRRVLELNTEFGKHVVVNPLVRRALAGALHRLRQILRRNAQLLGIPAAAVTGR